MILEINNNFQDFIKDRNYKDISNPIINSYSIVNPSFNTISLPVNGSILPQELSSISNPKFKII